MSLLNDRVPVVQEGEITEAFIRLEACRQEYLTAKTGEEIARKNGCETLNRLNQAQKEFDKLHGKMLVNSPVGSDWNLMARDKHLIGPLAHASERV